ncbi:nuclear pore complex protein Nup155-like [Watersipora subatra]|uniref:nuclear pore complex protein Nup155-like n=1 Tax=Watersipora subatra TaxID=2589382 RepID=UPI00355BF97C
MASLINQTVVLARPQDSIDQAAVELDKFVKADNNYDDLSKRLRVYSEQSPNDSGLMACDYPSLTDDKISLPPLPELSLVKRVPLPNELIEQFSHMQCNCMMGLFPEISRAWLTIDSDIFVWNYENGSDLAFFDAIKETIIACGLAKPKPGTCAGIPYLLVIATPIDIYLLGVTFGDVNSQGATSDPRSCDMNLLPAPLFALSTDNCHFLTIRSTSTGRIFLGARDGCLFEILYQSEESWFSKKCKLVNLTNSSMFSFLTPSFMRSDKEPIVQIEIDEGRNILYTKSEGGSIALYDLGADGLSSSHIADMSSTSITSLSAQILKTVDKSNFQDIVHIATVKKEESVHIHLVAVTASGVRLYFTTRPFTHPTGRPVMLKLVHVRLPPGFSASTTSQRPSKVHMAHYQYGTLLMVSAQSDDVDLLWTTSSDCFPFQSSLMETQMNMAVGGHTWAMTEEPNECVIWRRDPVMAASPKANPPLVVTQHMEQLRRFVLLSAQGSYILDKLRPVDQLRSLLIQNQGYDNRDVEAFFKLHKADQACATCLIIICSGLAIDAQVIDWATGAFFMFGGDPTYEFAIKPITLGPNFSATADSTMQTGFSFHPAQVSTPHPTKLGLNTSTMHSSTTTGGTGVPTSGKVVLSGKHDGIYIQLARILGPLWDSKLVGEVQVPGGKTSILKSRVDEELIWFIEQLSSLLNFLKNSSGYITSLNADGFTPNAGPSSGYGQVDEASRRKCLAEAVTKEKQSLQQLMVLVGRCLEVLYLWKLACDHQFEAVCGELKGPLQGILKGSTLKSLLGFGNEELSSGIIDGIVQRYLGDNACIDVISAKLRDHCPSLYSLDDAKCSKANELLQTLKTASTARERTSRLANALALYKEVSPHLNLQEVCQQLSAARHYDGILDICLTTASKRDPQNIALYYYKNGQSVDDLSGSTMFTTRMDCYNCILDTLKYLLSASYTTVTSPSVPNKPGPPAQKTQAVLTAAEAEQHVDSLYNQAVKTTDELFHIRLYEWMVENGLTDKLLQISSPYLEEYLKRCSSGPADSQHESLEVLWRYYEKNKDYNSAARILTVLADRPGTEKNLQQRTEYLSRAIMSAKSAKFTMEMGDGDMLHELEEKLDVARVQMVVLENVRRLQQTNKSNAVQNALTDLNSQLMDVTTLYGSYADPFDLAECKLAILHCASHHDSVLIETLWAAVIDKELELSERLARENKMLIVQNKVICLAKQYHSNDRFFPLAFVVKDMEMRSLASRFDESWVVNTMRLAQVPILRLLQTYDKLYKAKDPVWKNHGQPFHLLSVIASLLEIPDQISSLSPTDKVRFVTTAQDLISSYLVELNSSTLQANQSKSIGKRLREIQSGLQRDTR